MSFHLYLHGEPDDRLIRRSPVIRFISYVDLFIVLQTIIIDHHLREVAKEVRLSFGFSKCAFKVSYTCDNSHPPLCTLLTLDVKDSSLPP